VRAMGSLANEDATGFKSAAIRPQPIERRYL
jgi:hypothetical protein